MLKKFFTVILAVLCLLPAACVPACGQSIYCAREECVKLTNSGFKQKYIDLAIEYHNKETDKTVSYKKSHTKKFIDKLNAAVTSEKPEYTYEISDRHEILYLSRKNEKIKSVFHLALLYDCDDYIIYADGDSATVFYTEDKTKAKVPKKEIEDELVDISSEGLFFDDISKKGKYFKFKNGGKTYYYEEFAINESPSSTSRASYLGFLFDGDGNVLAAVMSDTAYYMSFKTTADDSEFTPPKGYTTVS